MLFFYWSFYCKAFPDNPAGEIEMYRELNLSKQRGFLICQVYCNIHWVTLHNWRWNWMKWACIIVQAHWAITCEYIQSALNKSFVSSWCKTVTLLSLGDCRVNQAWEDRWGRGGGQLGTGVVLGRLCLQATQLWNPKVCSIVAFFFFNATNADTAAKASVKGLTTSWDWRRKRTEIQGSNVSDQ